VIQVGFSANSATLSLLYLGLGFAQNLLKTGTQFRWRNQDEATERVSLPLQLIIVIWIYLLLE